MKIVIIGPYPEDIHCIKGGTESSVYGLAEALKNEHQVHVFDYPRMEAVRQTDVKGGLCVHRWRNTGKHNEDAVRCIAPMMLQLSYIQPDVVHVHGTDLFCYKVYRACQKAGYPVMSTVHGLLAVEKKNAMLRTIREKNWKKLPKAIYQYVRQNYTERALLNSAKSIIVDTEYVAEAIRQYGLRHLPELNVIPQGINDRYYDLKCSKTSKIILSVGTISRRKGRIQLIDAFDLLCESIPEAELVIAGTDKEKSTVAMVQDRIRVSPNKERIHLLLNRPQLDIFSLYEQAHLFALHTEEESQGIVFSEAMACGLPVVSTRVGGVPYVVKTENGMLCEFGDVEAMAKNMHTLMANDAKWEIYSKQCKLAALNYKWRNIADKIVKLYCE